MNTYKLRWLWQPLTAAHPVSESEFWRPPMRLSTFLLVMLLVKAANLLLTDRIQVAFPPGSPVFHWMQVCTSLATGLLVFLALLWLLSRVCLKVATPRLALPLMVGYLVVATGNATAVSTAMVMSHLLVNQSQEFLIVNLGMTFVMVVLVFSLWYQIADRHLPGGGFDFPPSEAPPGRPPQWFDYLFIAFNISALVGPPQSLRTRPIKALILAQTSISLVPLVLAVARMIQAT